MLVLPIHNLLYCDLLCSPCLSFLSTPLPFRPLGGSLRELMTLLNTQDSELHKHLVIPHCNDLTLFFSYPPFSFGLSFREYLMTLFLFIVFLLSQMLINVCFFSLFKVDKEIDPTFFGFRWITLLLSQEFLLPGEMNLTCKLFLSFHLHTSFFMIRCH